MKTKVLVLLPFLMATILAALAWRVLWLTADAQAALTISTEDGLSLTLSPDGRVMSLMVDGQELVSEPGPALWVRDMSNAGRVSEPNLLTNPGFEEGWAGWEIGAQVGTTVTITNGVSHGGGWSLQFHGVQTDTLGVASIAATPVAIVPGQRYRLLGYFLSGRGYVQGLNGTPPQRQDEVWRGIPRPNGLYLRWLDDEGQPLSDLILVAPLHWEAHNWRKIGGEVRAPPDAAQLELTIGGRLQDEYLWVDDLSIIPSPEVERPVTGTVTQQDNQLIQTATITPGLTMTATYTAQADYIAVHIELQDEAGLDRALEVALALPVNAHGWRWWDDVRHSRPISVGSPVASPPPECPLPSCLSWTYEHVVSGLWDGWLPISLYPYALIEDGDHGLALAVSLDSPRLVKISYDQEKMRYEARGYMGISPLAAKLSGRADLSLELYRVDPTWGFRAAIERFATRHSAWFESPRPLYGYSEYNRGFYTSDLGAQQVLTDDLNNVFSAQYIAAEASLKDGSTSEPLPTYQETIGLVEELMGSSKEVERACGEAITRSVAYNSHGDWQIKHVGEYPWAPGVWEVNWATNSDPDIAEGWGPFLWEWLVSPAILATEAISAVLDGVMIDNFMTTPGVDTRPDHLALTETPLTYQVATYQPGIHNAASVYEFLLWLRDRLDAQGRDDMAITINFWGIGTPNGLAPYIDAFGGERRSKAGAHINWNPRILDYRRAIAYHRPQTWANGEPNLTLEDVREFVNLALFYGIFPHRKDEATGWEEGSDQLITDTRQVLFQFWAAGWEPVTYAWTDNEAVWVERFGSMTNDQIPNPNWSLDIGHWSLCFTVHNTLTETVACTLTIDAKALQIDNPATLIVTELVSGEEMPFTVEEDKVLIAFSIEGKETRVFHLSGGEFRIYLPIVMKSGSLAEGTRIR